MIQIPGFMNSLGAEAYLTERFLWIIGRILEVVFLAVIIGLFIKFRHVIKLAVGPRLEHSCAKSRWVKTKRLQRWLVHLCCCGWAPRWMSMAEHFGFEELGPTGVLSVSLIAVMDLPKRLSFFIKVWAEPLEGPGKVSRVHREVQGRYHDLGGERLQLDWCGDEEELVVQALAPGANPGRGDHKLLAEMRISRAEVIRYAALSKTVTNMTRETAGVPNLTSILHGESPKAIRTFTLRRPGSAGPTSENAPLVSMVMSKVHASVGMEPADPEQVEHLREENRQMKALLSAQQKKSLVETMSACGDEHLDSAVMKVALQFEWEVPKVSHVNVFQPASREMLA